MRQRHLSFFVPKISYDEDNVLFSGLSTRQLKKTILASCGGYFNDVYYRMLSQDILYLTEDLDIFSELQHERIEAERKAMINAKNNTTKTESLFSG